MPIKNNFYSAEAHDILGSIPSWIVRWGVTILFLIFVGIAVGCYFIKYPQMVIGNVTITTINPPSNLAARYTGLLDSVYVTNGDIVKAGKLLMLFSTTADYDNIIDIEKNLIESYYMPFNKIVKDQWLNNSYILGDIQSIYADFQRQSMSYRHYLKIEYIDRKKKLLSTQISISNKYYDRLKSQQKFIKEELEYEKNSFKRDSVLHVKGIISTFDYETSARNMVIKKNTLAGFNASMTNTELSIVQTEQQLIELDIQKNNEISEHERTLSQLRQQLLSEINKWKEQYAVIAPTDGSVSLLNHWHRNQHVNTGDVLVSIVPNMDTKIIGRIHIPSAGFGKVKAGQIVNVKLNGFPYMEFGVLKGKIHSISAVPEQRQEGITYIAEVVFTNGLITTYHNELPLIQQMDGIGEVITKDLRLIEQFTNPIISLFIN